MTNLTNLKSLSQELGMSQTTVSRALNGFPEVSEKTRQVVLEAAAKHNYKPNTRARRLATGKSMTIGHLVSVSKEYELVNPIFADFIAGASARYAQSGYDLLLSLVPDEDEFTSYKELAARSTVDGVVVHTPRVDEQRIAQLNSLNLPFVVHGRSSNTLEKYNWVDVNNERSFFRATQLLIELGHTTIGLINGMAGVDFAVRRTQGYLRALKENNIELADAYVTHSEMTEPNGYKNALALLDLPDPPTAIVTSSIIMAHGIKRALDERELKLGRDVSVITHDDDLSYFRDAAAVPVYTATRSSVREAGRLSADLLLKTIADPSRDPEGILLDAELILGSSTKPPRLR
ncbi:substrate-binding domain-containing protein [Planktomarina sp.]|nr:substrate-binding domain-containing protein [Planktomarina sp.]